MENGRGQGGWQILRSDFIFIKMNDRFVQCKRRDGGNMKRIRGFAAADY